MFQTCPLKLISMLSKFLQNEEQMRVNIGKKLKTASLNSRFVGFKKEECTSTSHFKKILKPKDLKLLLTYEFTHQQPQGCFTSLKKNYSMEKVVFVSH